MAYQFAKKKDTPYVQDPVFVANFMKDFAREVREVKGAKYAEVDFGEFHAVVEQEKTAKETMDKEAKKTLAKTRKEQKEALRAKYGKAVVDGKEIGIQNWMVEPPGIFMGRGQHPLRGSWKAAVTPKDVTLNLGKEAKVPAGEWAAVVQEQSGIWIAKWQDKIMGKDKYVWPLPEDSPVVTSRMKAKYDKITKVGKQLDKIRARIEKQMRAEDEVERQTATAAFLIDRLGMRVGNEKGKDEADTVGATTLRVEHVKVQGDRVDFDFLGKDSVRWQKTHTDQALADVLGDLTKGKGPGELVFDKVDGGDVNRFFAKFGAGITAKTFRTYHATAIVERFLASKDVSKASDLEKVAHAKEANLEAAIYCNHKKTPPKNWDEQMRKKEEKLKTYRANGKETQAAKMQQTIEFAARTKEYNLGTSLANYIDPRVFKGWFEENGVDWGVLYTKSLQKKFGWC